jgi:hypothetical protein
LATICAMRTGSTSASTGWSALTVSSLPALETLSAKATATVAHDLGHVGAALLDLELPGVDRRDVEQPADQPLQAIDVARHAIEDDHAASIVQPVAAVPEDLGGQPQRGHGGAQLVRGQRHELVAHADRLLGLVVEAGVLDRDARCAGRTSRRSAGRPARTAG